ncbi:MAG: hypothetical protein U0168_15205 [Nannocystaceae bacterium]
MRAHAGDSAPRTRFRARVIEVSRRTAIVARRSASSLPSSPAWPRILALDAWELGQQLLDLRDELEVRLGLPALHQHTQAPAAVGVQVDLSRGLVFAQVLQPAQDCSQLGDVVGAAADELRQLEDLVGALEEHADAGGTRVSRARAVGVDDDRVVFDRRRRTLAQDLVGSSGFTRAAAHLFVADELAGDVDEVVGAGAVRLRGAEAIAELDAPAVDDRLAARQDADEDRLSLEVELLPGHGRREATRPRTGSERSGRARRRWRCRVHRRCSGPGLRRVRERSRGCGRGGARGLTILR